MEYAPTKLGFPPARRVSPFFRNRINFPLNGSAPAGMYNYKLEFGAEVINQYPVTAVSEVVGYDVPYVTKSDLENMLNQTLPKRRAFDIGHIEPASFPREILVGEEMAVSILHGEPDLHLFLRHADCHILCFVHKGTGAIRTDFGVLHIGVGDFVLLPRGTTFAFAASECLTILMYESTKRFMRPNHYWIDTLPFSASSIIPAFPMLHQKEKRLEPSTVWLKKHLGKWSRLSYPFPVLDAIAWEGELYPFLLHMKDIRTIASPNFHLDPKALTLFVTEDESFSLQVFLPRWVHSLPYPHQNYCTEVLFNHDGYAARPEIGNGCFTFHPPGMFHGPALGAVKKDYPCWQNEVAVMLESQKPLGVLRAAEFFEIAGYEASWLKQYTVISGYKPKKESGYAV